MLFSKLHQIASNIKNVVLLSRTRDLISTFPLVMHLYFKERSDIICSIFPGKAVAQFCAKEDLKEFSRFLLL